MNQKNEVRLIILLAIVSLTAATSRANLLPTIPSAHAQGSPTGVFITPYNQTFLSGAPPTVSVSVNVSQAPRLHAFEFAIHYNSSILRATTIDYNNTALVGGIPVIYCIDTVPEHGFPCKPGVFEQKGEIEFAMSINGLPTPPIVMGSLFIIRFNVISQGLAQIHIHSVHLRTATAPDYVDSEVELGNVQDGYFDNAPCGTRPCVPPDVRVSITPTPVVADVTAFFNVTFVDHNLGAKAIVYHWKWNDGSTPVLNDDQYNSSYIPLGSPYPHKFSSNAFSGSNGCAAGGLCLVDLVVYDSAGVSWEITINVVIPHLKIVLSVAGITLNPQYNVFPGTVISIKAEISNDGTIAENATLSISLENQVPALQSQRFSLNPSGGVGSLSTKWDTSGYSPRAYAIVVTISDYTSAYKVGGDFLKWENASSRNEGTEFVFLISPIPAGGLSLSILQTTGLAALVLVAAAVGLARFLKKPSYELEPLE